MNRFVKNRTTFSLILTWIFAVALFSDGANLTDLFTETTTIHFEEAVGAEDQCVGTVNPSALIPLFERSTQNFELTKTRATPVKRVLLDQDSPSLAATSILASESFAFSPQEEHFACRPIFLTESLYLRNHSFLL